VSLAGRDCRTDATSSENPAIVEAEKWYIDSLNNLPIAMR
jgi:hypothetical protein